MMSASEREAFLAFCSAAETPSEYANRMNSQEAFLAGRRSIFAATDATQGTVTDMVQRQLAVA